VAKQDQSEYYADINFDRIGECVGEFCRWAIVDVEKQRVADGRACHRQNKREQLEEQIRLLRTLSARAGFRAEAIRVVTEHA
jgi:hypothetical protein